MSTRRHEVTRFTLASGQRLRRVEQAYTQHGELNEARDNAVVLFHSLTSGPDPLDWWPVVVGPGRALDTTRYAVITANLLGSCYGTAPVPPGTAVTPRDMAALVRALLDDLGVTRVRLASGGSLGGMVALEWAASYPDLTDSVVVFAAPSSNTAYAIGLNHAQRRALDLGGDAGLAVARMIAMLSYRTAGEFEARFGRRHGDAGYAMQSYLDHHGEKLVRRFDAASYRVLMDAMDAHDVGSGRGGAGAALRAFGGYLLGVGIPGDLLYPADDVRSWTDAAGADYAELASECGHDAFLIETAQVDDLLRRALGHAVDDAQDRAQDRAQDGAADGDSRRSAAPTVGAR